MRAFLIAVALTLAATAQEPVGDMAPTAPVGVRGTITNVVLPPDLVVRDLERGEPLLLRIAAVWPQGELRRYDFEFQGFEPGRYDLAGYLRRADGTVLELEPVPVVVTSALPPGQVEPTPLAADRPPRLGGYQLALWVLGGLWVVGLGLILFGFRKRRAAAATAVELRPKTLAERLRPIVDAAMQDRLDDADKAELERLLVAHWDRRLGLRDLPLRDALARLRGHDEAGPLLRQLEAWLHRPGPHDPVDLEALLSPYRDVPDPGAPQETSR